MHLLTWRLPLGVAAVASGLYASLLFLLTTHFFQSHAIYLHAFQMTGGKDLNVPEMFGFLRGQVTPFTLSSNGSTRIHAWHILPIGLYREHEAKLIEEPAGLSSDITSTAAFKLLRDDPDARLIIHLHGAGGNIGSGYRVPNYKALSAAYPDKAHVLTFDYRGFGQSPGAPSEDGIIQDALAAVRWALDVAKVSPSRILIFSQSLGTAVNTAVAEHFAAQPKPTTFAGHILVAPFFNVPTLVKSYKLAGTVPLLSPVAKFPVLFDWLKSYIREDWATNQRMDKYIRQQEAASARYRLVFLHAEDDYDIPWQHTPLLVDQAVAATSSFGATPKEVLEYRERGAQDLGQAGVTTAWRTRTGIITERILKHGLHDVIMGNPIITLAVMEIFES